MAQEYELVKGFETENGTGLYDYEALANKPGVVSTGAPGFAPQLDGKTSSFLRGDGTWATPPNTTYNEATQSAAGLMSAADKKKVDGMGTTISNAINAIDYPVDSVNGKTGKVVLNHDDVGAVSWNEYAQAIVQKADVVKEAKGDLLTVSDSAEAPLQGLKIFGKTEQKTTTGKNLLNLKAYYAPNLNGLNISLSDGVLVLSGTANAIVDITVVSRNINNDTFVAVNNLVGETVCVSNNLGLTGFLYDGTNYANNKITVPASGINTCFVRIPSGSSYNNTKLYIQIEKGSAATEWEPYTGGKPSPNPDYSQELESVGDSGSVKVTACGKNLANLPDVESWTMNGVKFTCKNGAVTASGTSASLITTMDIIGCTLPYGLKGVYTLSGGSNSVHCYVSIKKADNSITYVENKSFTLDGTEQRAKVFLQISEANIAVNETVYPMLNVGEIASAFEPYTATTATVSTPNGLPGIPVTSGGNYTDPITGKQWICDEVDFKKGVYVQRVYRQTYIGSSNEAWGKSNSTDKDKFYTRYKVSNTMKPCLCNMATFIPTLANENGKCFVTFDSSNGNYYFQIIAGDYGTFAGPPEWCEYLGEHPLEVLYVLPEEKEIPLSEIDPDVLTQYATLYTNHPNTTVFNDGNAGMEIKYATPTTALPLTGGRYKVATPYAPTDAANKDYVDKNINTVRDIISSFHSNIVEEASGEVIQVYGSAEAPLQGLKVFGKTEQKTTTGKNLLYLPDKSVASGGLDWKVENGVVTINGTTTTTVNVWVDGAWDNTEALFTLAPGTYTTNCTLYSYDGATRDSNKGTFTIAEPMPVTGVYLGYYEAGSAVNKIVYAQVEKGSVATEWEPYTGGAPSPSPEYPQALESVGDSGTVTVTACGKNLFDGIIKSGYRESVDSALVATGGVYNTIDLTLPVNGTYTVSFDASVRIIRMNGSQEGSIGYTHEVELNAGRNYISFRREDNTVWNAADKIQVEYGIAATEYDVYKEPTTVTVTPVDSSGKALYLPGIPVESGGNYTDPVTKQQWICDEVDFEKGVYVQRVMKQIVKNVVAFSQTNTTGLAVGYDPSYASKAKYGIGMSNALKVYDDHAAMLSASESGCIPLFGGGAVVQIKGCTTIEELNAYLNENEVVVLFALQNENPIALTESERSAFASMQSHYPNTTVFNDAEAYMDLKYVADTKLYVDKKFEELAKILVNKL